jgi:Zn-dependent M28 family amino/carboxypeptidase
VGIVLFLGLFTEILWLYFNSGNSKSFQSFNGQRAYGDVVYQVGLGPRVPLSRAHDTVIQWIKDELVKSGWEVQLQSGNFEGKPITNIIATRSQSSEDSLPWVILGAHYDTRLLSDQDVDPNNWETPVPGANDGASGVAVLLELARSLPKKLPVNLWLVFFDAEDNGDLNGWDWIMGSHFFVNQLSDKPDAVVIVDMVGDKDLNIYQEGNSSVQLSDQIWSVAESLGYKSKFIPEVNHYILDDHVPFIDQGIPAVDIIDIEYPFWHTQADTADKISASSLQIVGETIYKWLVDGPLLPISQ